VAEIYVEVREAADPETAAARHARTLVDHSPAPVLVYELASRVIRYANQRLAELAGRSSEELAGLPVENLLQPVEPLLPAAEPTVPASPELLHGESLLHRDDGTPCRVEARTSPVDYDGVECGQVALWDITERVVWEQQLLHRASHDPLTGLPNAWYASIYMQKALRKPPGENSGSQHLAVFFVDLDGFKQINDTYGHQIGDAVLRQAAARLTTAVAGADLTARLHGDEFLVLCRVANAIHAAHLAQRIRRSLARPIMVGSQTLTVTASVGIAVSTAGGTSADRLLRFADHRMYTDKRHSPGGRRRSDQVRPTPAFTPAEEAALRKL
jgi:diguanylate cyclase (GGDEF)-like protein/PAS domain S-box-containing protein